MLKWLLSLITILAINSVLIAQRDSTRLANNATYLEIGGPAGYGSLNYERILVLKKKISLIARCGLSVNHIRDYTNKINPDILIPFSLGACYGSTHKIEAGLGQTIVTFVQAVETTVKPIRRTDFHTFLSIGYRYQKNSGGLLFRCSYTPIIEFNTYFRHWASISVGYSF